jgi:hypothetical protein
MTDSIVKALQEVGSLTITIRDQRGEIDKLDAQNETLHKHRAALIRYIERVDHVNEKLEAQVERLRKNSQSPTRSLKDIEKILKQEIEIVNLRHENENLLGITRSPKDVERLKKQEVEIEELKHVVQTIEVQYSRLKAQQVEADNKEFQRSLTLTKEIALKEQELEPNTIYLVKAFSDSADEPALHVRDGQWKMFGTTIQFSTNNFFKVERPSYAINEIARLKTQIAEFADIEPSKYKNNTVYQVQPKWGRKKVPAMHLSNGYWQLFGKGNNFITEDFFKIDVQ